MPPNPQSPDPQSEPGQPLGTGPTDWARVFDERSSQLAALALLHADSPSDAEDLLQDVLCAAIASAVVAKDPVAYLAGAMRNLSIDRRRRRRSFGRVIEARREVASGTATIDDSSGEPIDVEGLLAAVDLLSDSQREVVLLRTRGGLTFAQIAGVLNISPNTIASLHRRALMALRPALAEESDHELA